MDFNDLIGQTLDAKYNIERELGRGGMGTVYLATHVGTGRPVAVKIIAPQFMMRAEFVERFRREARAAGRLRHPNVVNVTDFGFADTHYGRVAYLVMEYLDGCTLGEILEEENNLPVGWTLDIIEQVCSAVQEAHAQGIIHRDLKPDNIWLEPNQRGGYTVKVLDFGIAKLESVGDNENGNAAAVPVSAASGARVTIADNGDQTIHDSITPTMISEASTAIISPPEPVPLPSEHRTMLQPLTTEGGDGPAGEDDDADTVSTRLISESGPDARPFAETGAGAGLTRVGAVLGTPLYMSPEQCRSERLDARSDIYSIGVIAYQMLSGSTPFAGDFNDVMDAHKNRPIPQLRVKKVRKKLERVVMSALSKDPDERPQTAEAFATSLRARSEGIFGLLRRSVMIYTEHIDKFIPLAFLLFLPFIVGNIGNIGLLLYFGQADAGSEFAIGARVVLGLVTTFTAFFCGYLVVGTTTWLVNQMFAVPLRPVKLRPALSATRKIWKRLIATGMLSTVLSFIGYAMCFLPGLVLSVLLALVAPVVMMEGLSGFKALKRSKELVLRSLRTTTAAVAILFFVPLIIAGATSLIVAMTVKQVNDVSTKIASIEQQTPQQQGESQVPAAAPAEAAKEREVKIEFGDTIKITDFDEETTPQGRAAYVVREGFTALFMVPIQILLTSLSSIIIALLYLKTRQAGGESLNDLLSKFEETEQPRKRWQERVRQRLIQSGRITGRT